MKDTSLMAYAELLESGKLQKMEKLVLQAFANLGGKATNYQVSEYLKLPINQITGRTNSLVKKNAIYAYDRVKNKATGKLNWEFRIYPDLFNSINN
tara:strand:- start:317 stop:604 length:288 start_codon:yes stop_codon:yes gene_type:complete